MASSRDDFIIAIRSAFLKKSTQQKFSLLTLVFLSIFIILLSSLNFKVIKYLKIGINEIVYRSSFLVSLPENFLKDTFIGISDYTTFFNDYKKNKVELNKLKSNNVSSEIIEFENKELKELINDYISSSNKILAKIIVDHDSPFLKSIIINKGSKDSIKIGTNIYDQSYLVGRVIEVNYKTARVLLLSDLNSNVPVTISPENIQAIITGTGGNHGQIKYMKDGFSDNLTNQSIIYTSGTGAIFKSGIPIGKLKVKENELTKRFEVEFYSDFSQLKYVFAEIIVKTSIESSSEKDANIETPTPFNSKLKILEDELKIVEDTKLKFKEENENLKKEINILNSEILNSKKELSSQKKTIDQFNIDKDELKFLKLNLKYGHKCRKSFFNSKGFLVDSPEYKNCVLTKGRIING
ncbi:rod shape-determining protein MreC [Pelagibacterales bacterium SAG-MED39]|nr:rod shape-determining protein MreC [Pelagibacterales bacterium SAG-MED39]